MQRKRNYSKFIAKSVHLVLKTLACCTVAGAWTLHAQTYLLDFGATSTPTTNVPPLVWNNITDVGWNPTGQLTNLVGVDNSPSEIDFIVINRFNGPNENGTTTSSIYPANATRDSLYGNTEDWGGLTNIFPKFKLAGLDGATSYSFSFYASRTGVGDNRETAYTVEGATTEVVTLDPANNIDNTVSVLNLKPNASGEIIISLAPTENNNNGNHFTYLGVLRIDAVPPQTPITFKQQPVSQRIAMYRPVTFTASVTGAPPYTIQWYQDNTPIPDAIGFTYQIASAGPELDGARFSVSVSNLVYGAHSTNAVLQVVSDTNGPVVTSVRSVSGLNVELVFDESLEPLSAAELSFYTVNGQSVESATLLADGKTVFLRLTQPIAGAFNVAINGVVDLASNPVAPNTSVAGNVLLAPPEYFLFDFGGGDTTVNGPAPDDLTNIWNNVTGGIGSSDFGELPNLVTTRGRVTEAGLMMIRRFNGSNLNGTQTGGPFAVDATRDSLYGNTELFGTLSNVFPSFKLVGLATNTSYILTFYASRTGVGDNRETDYTVEGVSTQVVTLNASANVTNTVSTTAVTPTSAGEITVSLAPSPRNNNANHFTYLGVMRLVPVQVELKFNKAKLVGGQIQIEWTGDGVLEWASTPGGNWTAVTPAPTGHSHSEAVGSGQARFFRLKK